MDIVIVSYAKNEACYDITYKCLRSLFESDTTTRFNVFVVESNREVNWDVIDNRIKTVYPEMPYGYHKFLNFGRKQGNAEFVALCNNDLKFRKNWANKIFEASDYNPNYFSFCPIDPWTQPNYGIQLNTGLIKGYVVRTHISGWCIVQKRSIYDIIGNLDERFTHWYCDNDYAKSIQIAGINHMLVTTSIVEHHDKVIGKTTEEIVTNMDELKALTYDARTIFEEKWGS